MNDKDKEAFEDFFNKHYGFSGEKDAAIEAWQAACEFMQDEVEKLEAQNEIMSNDLDQAGNELFIQEGKIKELEAKLRVAVEALELITKIAYHLDYKDHKMLARETLEKIKGEK
jgi:hypothetical protein